MVHAMILGGPEWIRLGEALRRYDVAIGYTEPQAGFIVKSHGAGLLHNAIRAEMSKCLTKSGASGQVRFKGASNTETSLTEIPTEYFRVARTFTFENEILPYAAEQTTEEWVDSRNHGNRHPTWIDVLVHRTSFGEWLKDVYSECLRPSTSDPAYLPDKQSLTLAETTSFLAFGHALEGSQISEWCDPNFKERMGLIERCSSEAEGKPEFSHWPSSMKPDAQWLASNLFIENTPQPWPPSAERLYQLAVEQTHNDKYNSLRFAVAEALIHNWAFNGKLKITGVKTAFTEHEEIDHRSFATRYELDWWFGNCISPPLFENDGRFTWSKVFVERSSLASMLEKYKVPAADPESEIVSFAKETRWGLVPTLNWIATLDITLAAHAAKPGTTFQGADIGLSVRKASFKLNGTEPQWPHESLNDAWKNELAVRMSEGTLKAFATCVSAKWDGGYSQNTPGVVFPPANAPGAALDHFIDDGNDGPFLRPVGSQGANSWTEWHNVTFARVDILRIWPERQDEAKEKPKKETAIWDYAFGKFPNDKAKRERLVADLYSAFWRGEFARDGLTLLQDQYDKPGSEPFNGLTRNDLALSVLGEGEFARLGESAAFDFLAAWNIADYRKIRDGFRYQFCPDDDVAGHKRGLCATSTELAAWFVASPYEKLARHSNQAEPPRTKGPSTTRVIKTKLVKKAAKIVLAELMMAEWPDGLPHNLKAPDRDKRINELSKSNGGSVYSARTIVRALEIYNANANSRQVTPRGAKA